jgi:hypothetical protein
MRNFSNSAKVNEIYWYAPEPEISFSQFSQKPSTLAHMLLHKSKINVAIPDILSKKQRSLYDLQEPKYKNSGKKGVAPDMVTTFLGGRPNFFYCLEPYEHI